MSCFLDTKGPSQVTLNYITFKTIVEVSMPLSKISVHYSGLKNHPLSVHCSCFRSSTSLSTFSLRALTSAMATGARRRPRRALSGSEDSFVQSCFATSTAIAVAVGVSMNASIHLYIAFSWVSAFPLPCLLKARWLGPWST